MDRWEWGLTVLAAVLWLIMLLGVALWLSA
ncbi:MAG: hypothetical protein QOJ53_525 [Sphingomonadales bacterium]|jgi:hypothetical protein|nr:hypothetical protein [Sphingomonadales bacterium]MEA3044347.1 hypothetical protein [Sphingomonadales bacterium]MEA3046193.1 hypothetical protein [Sphingomonadales bacterium]